MQLPYHLILILASLGAILLVNGLTRRLTPAVLCGILVLVLGCGFSPGPAVRVAWRRLASGPTLGLLVIVLEVVWFSSQLQKTGIMPELVGAVRGMTPGRPAFVVLPAVIGLLPMPGGALFSAPLVDECDAHGDLSPLLKTRINYWFRHIWEYFWPLYPGVLLAVSLTGMEIWQFALVQFPLSVISLGSGVFFLLRKTSVRADPGAGEAPVGTRGAHTREFFRLVAPIFLVIAVYAAVRVLVPRLAEINRYLPMIVGLLAGGVLLQIRRPLPLDAWKSVLGAKRTWIMVVLVALIRVYGAYIEADLPDGMSLVAHVRAEMEQFGVPVMLMIVLLPFVTGLTTGLAVGFVGASFPIVLSIAGPDMSFGALAAVTAAAYASGYVGMLLSPVHICLVVTNQHFGTRVSRSLWYLIPPALTLFVLAMGYAALLRFILP